MTMTLPLSIYQSACNLDQRWQRALQQHDVSDDEKQELQDDEIISLENILNYILHRGKLVSIIINSKSSKYGAILDNKKQKLLIAKVKKQLLKEINKNYIKINSLSTAVLIKEQEEDSLSIQTIRCEDKHKPLF